LTPGRSDGVPAARPGSLIPAGLAAPEELADPHDPCRPAAIVSSEARHDGREQRQRQREQQVHTEEAEICGVDVLDHEMIATTQTATAAMCRARPPLILTDSLRRARLGDVGRDGPLPLAEGGGRVLVAFGALAIWWNASESGIA
jgi:hypothetical protein